MKKQDISKRPPKRTGQPELSRQVDAVLENTMVIDRLNEFHWGQFFLSKIQWVLNLVILLKIFSAPLWAYIVFPICILVVTWFTGFVTEKTGIRLKFVRANFRGTNLE